MSCYCAKGIVRIRKASLQYNVGHRRDRCLWILAGESMIIASSVQHALGILRNIQEPKIAELLLVYIGDEQVPVSLREEALVICKSNIRLVSRVDRDPVISRSSK